MACNGNGNCLNRCLCICGMTSTCTCVHSETQHKTYHGGHDLYVYCKNKSCDYNCGLVKCSQCKYRHPRWVLDNQGLCKLCTKNG